MVSFYNAIIIIYITFNNDHLIHIDWLFIIQVVSTSGGSNVDQVMLYSFDNSCFKRPDHLELFEKYLYSLT